MTTITTMQWSNLTWHGHILWGVPYVPMVSGMAWLLHLKRLPNQLHTINRQTHLQSSRISTTEINRQRIALNFWALDNEHSVSLSFSHTRTQWLRHTKTQFGFHPQMKIWNFRAKQWFCLLFCRFLLLARWNNCSPEMSNKNHLLCNLFDMVYTFCTMVYCCYCIM